VWVLDGMPCAKGSMLGMVAIPIQWLPTSPCALVNWACSFIPVSLLVLLAYSQMRQRYQSIYEDFKPQFWFYKVVILLRRLLFAVIIEMCSNYVTLQVISWAVMASLVFRL
jgi:hypothetical protein